MIDKLKKRMDQELKTFLKLLEKSYSIKEISPLLFNCIKDFILRDGKRLRPILFVIGYKGFAKKEAKGLYTSALAIELLHDFMLIHDDIIDKSATRRGKPSMHVVLNQHLKKFKNLKFNGQDLSIIVGDVMYATSINAFLEIKENMQRKERALRKFIEAAIFTGGGEFIELINDAKDIENIKKRDIEKIYDYKTAYYTFSSPLVTGAILAGATDKEVNKLLRFGLNLGRAFQIKDDIIGMFENEKKIGKSILADLQESKRTLLIWQAFQNSSAQTKKTIKKILNKRKVNISDLKLIREIVINSGSLDYAVKEIKILQNKAASFLASSKIKPSGKKVLEGFAQKTLEV